MPRGPDLDARRRARRGQDEVGPIWRDAMYPIRTILFPTDFSDLSRDALNVAAALARDHRARLVILHVIEQPVAAGEAGMILPLPEGYREKAEAQLAQVPVPDPGLAVDRRLEEGPPVEVILRLAAAEGCDLIVLGTHGRTGLRRLLMGSTAEEILRRARCPVLTVRAPVPGAGPEPREATPEPAAAGRP